MTLYGALAAADTGLATLGRHRERWITKPLLMPALLRGKPRATQTALALGGAGDVALQAGAFTAGLGAFLAGHLAWMAALRPHSRGAVTPLRAAPYFIAWVGFNAYLWRRTGRDRIPVVLYSTALLGTGLASLDTGQPAGGVLFLLSDGLLALERFGGVSLPLHEGLVMATYTTAQSLLAQSTQVRA
ncbi:MAG: hypothetical protein JWM40_968 [Frankiales bacterium]|nr:hypothetical protein [Frankiales bacterium]